LQSHEEDIDEDLSLLLQTRAHQAKQLVPAASRRSFEYYYLTLCRLYCNIFGVGVSTASSTLAGRSWHTGGPSGKRSNSIYRELALTLYCSAAMANHSCEPNCAWSTDSALLAFDEDSGEGCCFDTGTVRPMRGHLPIQEIRTTRAASAGSELLINYVMIHQGGAKVGGKKRRRRLRSGFFFDCRCKVSIKQYLP
jgi:hypothetical protein